MLLFLFLNDCLIDFKSCNYCAIFNPIAELTIPIGVPIKEATAEI